MRRGQTTDFQKFGRGVLPAALLSHHFKRDEQAE